MAKAKRSGAKRLKLVWTIVKICSDLGLNVEKSDALHAVTGVRLSNGIQGLCGVVESISGMIPVLAEVANKGAGTK